MVLILFVQVLKKVLKSLKFVLKNPAATLFSHYQCLFAMVYGNKIWQELRVKLCQNKFSLIMSDNFDRKVCDGLQSTKIIQTAVSMTIFTQL